MSYSCTSRIYTHQRERRFAFYIFPALLVVSGGRTRVCRLITWLHGLNFFRAVWYIPSGSY